MAILPEGFALPPLPYLVVLAASLLAVVALLYRDAPPVTERVVLALTPWMVTGSAFYVCYQIGAIPSVVAPLFGSPAVYGTTFVCLGVLWIAANRLLVAENDPSANGGATDDSVTTTGPVTRGPTRTGDAAIVATVLGVVGAPLALGTVAVALAVGAHRGSLQVVWPAIGLLVSLGLAAVVWLVVRRGQVGETGWAGALVVFSHALDGVSTAVGVDVLGFGEQTPLARAFLELAASLPVSDSLGTGWLFIVVKIALAVVVAWLLADTVRERPREGYLFCAFVAAVGLGPGAHNLLLFTVAG